VFDSCDGIENFNDLTSPAADQLRRGPDVSGTRGQNFQQEMIEPST